MQLAKYYAKPLSLDGEFLWAAWRRCLLVTANHRDKYSEARHGSKPFTNYLKRLAGELIKHLGFSAGLVIPDSACGRGGFSPAFT
jgi:hypothetical protein